MRLIPIKLQHTIAQLPLFRFEKKTPQKKDNVKHCLTF